MLLARLATRQTEVSYRCGPILYQLPYEVFTSMRLRGLFCAFLRFRGSWLCVVSDSGFCVSVLLFMRPEQVVKRLPWFSGWEPGKGVGSPWVNCAGSLGPGSPRHCADVNIGSFPRVFSMCVFFSRFYWLVVLDFLASGRL